MDVLFLVVDSLRAHPFDDGRVAKTPFLDGLSQRALCFERAYATECWTLPSHTSMFTGLMPSEHGAHFHNLAYCGSAPTLAQLLSQRGYFSESATRNFVFDGTIPGVVRGFQKRSAIVSPMAGYDPTALFLAFAKPRVRRHLRNTGFFHALHRTDRRFVARFARSLLPADDHLLDYLLDDAAELRRSNRRFFLFANLYDVHAPYAPSAHSLLRPWRTIEGLRENLLAPYALSRLGEHRYLRGGFHLAEPLRILLRERYRRAVELADARLARFFDRFDASGLRDETVVVVVGDHGEGFGEHGLFLHDGSLFETHLHVPLWIVAPGAGAGLVGDIVSTRHLFGLIDVLTGGKPRPTLLDAEFRGENPVAYAQHFYYPHVRDCLPRYRCCQFAVVGRTQKVIARSGAWEAFDLTSDQAEQRPQTMDPAQAVARLRADVGECAKARARFEEEWRRFGRVVEAAE